MNFGESLSNLLAAWPVLLFVAGAVFVLYTLFGYPVLLRLWAKARGRPTRKAFAPCRVSVLLAVYNGEAFLRAKLDSLLAMDYPKELLEILVLSDGSTDATDAIARSYAPQGVKLVRVPNGGKALALNAGRAAATGEIFFYTDVRQRVDANCLRYLVECFADPSVGAVSGELIILDGQTLGEANVGLYWKYEKFIRKQLSALDSVLGATGCVYAQRRELTQDLPAGCILDDMYQPLQAFAADRRVIFEERARVFDIPTGIENEFPRKVRTLAGNYQLMRFLPWLLLPWRNRQWIHFVSHKLARLVLPYVLLSLFALTFFLPAPWHLLLLAAQLAVYALVPLDLVLPEGFPLKRLTSPARTFVVMMAASAAAIQGVIPGRQIGWKSAARETARS